MKTGIYTGSFDPFTLGHLHIVEQASNIFDKVIILMASNPDKKRRTSIIKMVDAIEQSITNNNIEIIICNSLVTEFCKSIDGDKFLIRGLRNGADFDYEENLAKINEHLNPELKTIYLRAGDKGHVSSSAVMEIFKYGGDISNWVTEPVYKLMLDDQS